MKLLVSVRTPEEALLAATGGADFIDLKEPGAGALGGLPLVTVQAIVRTLRAAGSRLEISATIGDWPMADGPAILARVAAMAATGVDIVKVGILPEPGAAELLHALGRCGARVVPVFIADQALDGGLLALALADVGADVGAGVGAGGCPFAGVMADTADKQGGSLLQRRTPAELRAFVGAVQAAGRMAGLAGALRLEDLPALRALAPDFAGFRSAVCEGRRDAPLSAQRLRALALAAAAPRAQPQLSAATP